LIGCTAGFADFRVYALAGARVLMTNLVGISAGFVSCRSDGSNSLVDLSALIDHRGAGTTFEARNGGSLLIPSLTMAHGAMIRVGLNGTIDTAHIVSITNGGVYADGAHMEFPLLTNLMQS